MPAASPQPSGAGPEDAGEELLASTDPAGAEVLHVKLADDAASLDAGQPGAPAEHLSDALTEADAEVEPLFERSSAELDADKAGRKAISGDDEVDLSRWLRIEVGNPALSEELIDALNDLEQVELALPAPVVAPASLQADPASPDHEPNQVYRDPAPAGVSADHAATVAGGTGANVTIADIEFSWAATHEDLVDAVGAELPNGTPIYPPALVNHGTAVLGIVGGEDNGFGVTGLAPDADLALVNVATVAKPAGALAEAIDLAATTLHPGDVLLIEQQLCLVPLLADGSCAPGWLPVEAWPAFHDAISAATGNGIVVVEPAGNGGRDIDATLGPLAQGDSGAILVGAGNPPVACRILGADTGPARGRLPFSNHGTRVDVQAQGACVWTTGSEGGAVNPVAEPDRQYTRAFSGTSAASAIVAGVAASLSSAAYEADRPLAPRQLRDLLRSTGTPQSFESDPDPIGPQPDLARAINAMLALPPATPPNDHRTDATVIATLPARLSQHTVGASVEADEPVPTCGAVSGTVWFTVEPPRSGRLTVQADGSRRSPAVAIWRSAPGGDLAARACRVAEASSPVVDDVEAGATYLIQVGDTGGGTISVKVELAARAPSCDLNADGYGDALLGAPSETIDGAGQAGAVNVVYGHPRGQERRAPILHQGSPGVAGVPEVGDAFGSSLACGDVNGDGYDDAVVGVPGESRGKRSSSGVAQVFYGGPAGIGGHHDQLLGQASPGVAGRAEAGDRFGAAVAVADLDGDGHAEIIIGVPGESRKRRADAGAVVIVPGSAAGADTTRSRSLHQGTRGIPSGPRAGERFGASLAVGDTDHDGLPDLYIGAPGERLKGRARQGAVTEVPGAAGLVRPQGARLFRSGRRDVAGSAADGSRFGDAIDVADLDGDGFADLMVGAPNRRGPTTGWVEVLPGSPGGLRRAASIVISPGDAVVAGSATAGNEFGASITLADTDGDGTAEAWVGSPGVASHGGAVIMIELGSGLTVTASMVLSQNTRHVPGVREPRDRFGAASGSSDLDGDGFADLVIGAPGEGLKGRSRVGWALIVPGSSDGVALKAARAIHQGKPGVGGKLEPWDQLGAAVG